MEASFPKNFPQEYIVQQSPNLISNLDKLSKQKHTKKLLARKHKKSPPPPMRSSVVQSSRSLPLRKEWDHNQVLGLPKQRGKKCNCQFFLGTSFKEPSNLWALIVMKCYAGLHDKWLWGLTAGCGRITPWHILFSVQRLSFGEGVVSELVSIKAARLQRDLWSSSIKKSLLCYMITLNRFQMLHSLILDIQCSITRAK